MKKLFLIVLLLLSFMSLTSCGLFISAKSEIPEVMGEWDNNYIYYKNKMCKTTGEDEITLFEGFIIDNNYYNEFYFIDHIFIDNILYCCVDIKNEEINALLKYSINTGHLEVIYTTMLTIEEIIKYTPNYLLIFGDELTRIDLNSYEANAIDISVDYKIYDDIILFTNEYALYMYNLTTNTIEYICDKLPDYNMIYELNTIEDRTVLVLKFVSKSNSQNEISRLSIYDIENKNKNDIYNLLDYNFKHLYSISGEYYLTGIYDFVSYIDKNDKIKYNKLFYSNSELYKISYNENTKEYEFKLLYDFDDKYDCTRHYIDGDNIRFKLMYLKKDDNGINCAKYKKVKFSIKKEKLSSAIIYHNNSKSTIDNSDSPLYIEFGNYTYYFIRKRDDSIFWEFYNYYFYRKKGLKTEVMQFYTNFENRSIKEFPCSSFIESCTHVTDPNKILITDFKLNK